MIALSVMPRLVQKIHQGDEETARAEACFTYPELFPPRPGGKDIHDAGALKEDVLRFFKGIDHVEIAVVILFVHKIGRDLHGQVREMIIVWVSVIETSHAILPREKQKGDRLF